MKLVMKSSTMITTIALISCWIRLSWRPLLVLLISNLLFCLRFLNLVVWLYIAVIQRSVHTFWRKSTRAAWRWHSLSY
jgi:hypothetical protein